MIGQQVSAHTAQRETQQEVAQSPRSPAYIAQTTLPHKFEDSANPAAGNPNATLVIGEYAGFVAKIRVQLIDDHSVVRAGVRMLVDHQADMQVVSEASSALEAVRQAREILPDVMVLDIALPGCSGLDAIAPLREASPHSRILILSSHDDQAYLRLALAAGASGYVAKQASAAELTQAIRTVAAGRSYVNVTLAGSQDLKTLLTRGPRPGSLIDALSKRERQVLALIASGQTNQAAAGALAIGVKTVETYRRRLMEKLDVSDRAGLVRIALECGLIARSGDPRP